MRFGLLIAAALAGLSGAAFADDAADLSAAKATIAAANLSATSDLDMWCGAAMTLVAAATKDTDAAKSNAADSSASAFFGDGAASLTADGVKQEDIAGLGSAYMAIANAQLVAQTDPLSHNVDDCVVN